MFGLKAKKQILTLHNALNEADKKINELGKQFNSLRTILENMVEGVISIDKKMLIVSINPSIEKIFGIFKKDAEGKFFLETIPNNDIAEIINAVLKNAEFISQELSLVWPIKRTFQINASPLFQNNEISGCLVVIHDITQIRRLEKVRSDFVANVSHELKTPLTSIKGFVETLLSAASEDKENSRQFLKIIQRHSERLENIINDLLELSHIESGEMKLEIKDLKLKDIIEEALLGFKAKLNTNKIDVENNLTSALLVLADKDRIEQVLTNLIDNAVKFNRERGFIKIYSQDMNDKIKIVVEDSGIGIPEKDIPRIFERFYRVDKARSRNLGGTGLGLSIVKHIVELHGGSVGVESTEGLGSKFWFILPFNANPR